MSHPSSSSVPTPPTDSAAAPVAWADPVRKRQFEAWLGELAPARGLRADTVRLASADASFRRYLRVDTVAGDSRIVMDAPPDKENSEPFVKVAGLMHAAGLRAPEVLEWQQAQGFMLLSDLGAHTMMSALDPGQPAPDALPETSSTPASGPATTGSPRPDHHLTAATGTETSWSGPL